MKNYVITIGRQFASGGREIGRMLADRLSIAFYDAPHLREKAKEIGVDEGVFNLYDEKPSRSFLFSAAMDPYSVNSAVSEGRVIEAQRKVITNAVSAGACVIVGRRADKILEDNENLVSIFISADMQDRIARYLQRDGANARTAKRFIEKMDKERASYYNYCDDGGWGKADNYSMCFNTSKMDKKEIVEIICSYVNAKFAE